MKILKLSVLVLALTLEAGLTNGTKALEAAERNDQAAQTHWGIGTGVHQYSILRRYTHGSFGDFDVCCFASAGSYTLLPLAVTYNYLPPGWGYIAEAQIATAAGIDAFQDKPVVFGLQLAFKPTYRIYDFQFGVGLEFNELIFIHDKFTETIENIGLRLELGYLIQERVRLHLAWSHHLMSIDTQGSYRHAFEISPFSSFSAGFGASVLLGAW